jgi:hypothetical protein
MSRRAMLWSVGGLAFFFMSLAAVNASKVVSTGNPFDGSVTGQSGVCGGFGELGNWFGSTYLNGGPAETSCSSLLPERLGALAIGFAILLICGYYAEKGIGRKHLSADFASTLVEGLARPSTLTYPETQPPATPAVPAPPVAAPATPETKTCPDCAEEVKAAARKCRFCGHMFESAEVSG